MEEERVCWRRLSGKVTRKSKMMRCGRDGLYGRLTENGRHTLGGSGML